MLFSRFSKLTLATLAASVAVVTAVSAQTKAPPATPAAPAAAPGAPPAAAPAGPPPILAFEEALTRAATNLLTNAKIPAQTGKIPLVIDPLIDGVSGIQSSATRYMETRLREIVRKDHPKFELLPFTAASIDRQPVVMVGTFTAVNNAGQAQGARDAYRICFALADLKSKTIVGKAATRANPEGVRHIPTAFFNETPVMGKDESTEAYVKTCQASQLAAAIDSTYVARVKTAALVSDAIGAYEGGKYREALDLYTKAKAGDGGTQLRVYNGVYLTNWRLGRRKAASEAFAEMVDYGLKNNQLNVRFLFKPGSTSFIGDRRIRSQYPTWLARLALAAEKNKSCLETIGHASRTGPEPVNVRLSKLRADSIRTGLVGYAKGVEKRVIANGAGSSQALIGTGKDDASDALDRRVEFKQINC